MLEGVPNNFFCVSYEDSLLRFGFELIRLKLFHISITAPNFKKRLRESWIRGYPDCRTIYFGRTIGP